MPIMLLINEISVRQHSFEKKISSRLTGHGCEAQHTAITDKPKCEPPKKTKETIKKVVDLCNQPVVSFASADL